MYILRIAIKHECIFRTLIQQKQYLNFWKGVRITNLTFLLIKSRFFCRPIHARASKFQSFFRPCAEATFLSLHALYSSSTRNRAGWTQMQTRPCGAIVMHRSIRLARTRNEPAVYRFAPHCTGSPAIQGIGILAFKRANHISCMMWTFKR